MEDQEINPYESPKTVSKPDGEPVESEPVSDAEGPVNPTALTGDSIVTIASFGYISEANIAMSLFEQEGIECCLDNEGIVSVNPFLSNAVGGVKVLVRECDAERAARFLHDHQQSLQAKQSTEDIEFDCEECGARLKFSGKRRGCVETCPKCREFIDVPD